MWFNSMQREEPYLHLTFSELSRDALVPSGTLGQVLHGCRRLVPGDVGLSLATTATFFLSCKHLVGHSKETAGDKPEEGGDDVKSSWPLRVGLHTCYNGEYRGKRTCEGKRTP